MSSETKIPLVVSVTGHRHLRAENVSALETGIRKTLSDLKGRFPDTEIRLMTNLAEGADSLAARIAIDEGIPLIAALPLPREEYRTDFSGDSLAEFDRFCALAETVFCVPNTEKRPEGATRDFDYRQGGLYLVRHSQVLIAIWEGNPAKPGGCGTAEVVDFAGKEHLPIIHIVSPREETTGLSAGEIRTIGSLDHLARLNEYNAKAAADEAGAAAGIFPPSYYEADRLSQKAAVHYRRDLKLISVAGTALAVAFLLYDELGLGAMIFVCGVLLLFLGAIRLYTRKSRCHQNYMEFRVLAESLRVQSYLRHAGSKLCIGDLFTVYQKAAVPWVTQTLPVLEIGDDPQEQQDISDIWFREQLAYHRQAANLNRKRLGRNNRILYTACILSVALYLFAIAIELLSSNPALRTFVGVGFGGFSAATLFISLYFGRLSVSRQSLDHRMMAEFYETALKRYEMDGQTEDLLSECAREELVENGNWLAYTSENAPDISFI